VSRMDLVDSRASRNFWVYINKDKIWSATGVSKERNQIAADKFNLEAGLLWHKVSRENKFIGLKAEILSFVPVTNEPIEIMWVKITNISCRQIKFIPIAAIPIYGRSANNLRDHRQVTSLLQRITLNKFGVIVKPTLVFDERGHHSNKTYYFILGWDEKGFPPEYVYPTQEMFCGEAGDLEAPTAIINNLLPDKTLGIQGREAMGALRFRQIILKPGQSHSYIVLLGISESQAEIKKCIYKFRDLKKVEKALKENKAFWIKKSEQLNIKTGDKNFDNWLGWVSIQPTLRRIFGCSFLPDFDYGKGGRGWRDLWQDLLALILKNPYKVRPLLLNNFCAVRIDGTNATIIGKSPGEFIADRNNIQRVWMDHGVWPLLTLDLYLKKTDDYGILFKRLPYFESSCTGTVLEHLLIQNLRPFYNLGEHKYVRLEGADWNDGLDMAKERGESVTFSCMYAANLRTLVKLMLKTKRKKLRLSKLLFSSPPRVTAEKRDFDVSIIVKKLERMSQEMTERIRKQEWLKEGFFNGYYDNKGRRVEGRKNGIMRMCLASQVFAILSGVATDEQVEKIIQSTKKYLWDKKLGGYHLNTNFQKEEHDLGRAFSFVYGDKENGAIFNHMNVMFAYALLSRGFRKEGMEVLRSVYQMSINTARSKIYPCLPEYFNAEGKGMYAYLTGSASWFLFTLKEFSPDFICQG
ncbi:MAG: cellobiose phosphorylase, partial [Candidatus Omnitrophica bacterium]|nr:cellobiose phosphorylase [Candidatus Omnitrophota bacterium]